MKTYSFINKKEIKMKDGTVLHEGKRFEIRWEETELRHRPRVKASGTEYEYKISNGTAIKMLGKKQPSISSLSRWDSNGNCKSLLGETVEPDGIDSYGSPSWLLHMNLI
jgi:hypothetical protein